MMEQRRCNPLLNALKKLVSRKKYRLKEGGFDLDLSYITENIIAMGFPSQQIESLYRNNMEDVVRFFDQKHPQHYKIYNLCQQRKYSPLKFGNRVAQYPFQDHLPPPFHLLFLICKDIRNFLSQHPQNVVGVHCKAGKGRTGVVICCYLLYQKVFQDPDQVISYFAKRRTANCKGVTIPSQLRYINYFARAVSQGLTKQVYCQKCSTTLLSLTIITIPQISMTGGCKPFFIIRNRSQQIFDSRKSIEVKRYIHEAKAVFQPLAIPLHSDFMIEVYHKSLLKHQKMFWMWLNAYFCKDKVIISRRMLDGLQKMQKQDFSQNLHVELDFAAEGRALSQ